MTRNIRDLPQLNPLLPVVIPAGFRVPVAETLPVVIQRIARTLQPERIVLFGSYAYGIPTPDSDVDLLVVMDDDASPLDAYLKISRLLRPRPFPIDLVVKTPNELRHSVDANDIFIREILSRGTIVYEREH